jgi:hypothetical protein
MVNLKEHGGGVMVFFKVLVPFRSHTMNFLHTKQELYVLPINNGYLHQFKVLIIRENILETGSK